MLQWVQRGGLVVFFFLTNLQALIVVLEDTIWHIENGIVVEDGLVSL